MAYKGKVVYNKKTNQTILFIQTSKDSNGALLEMQTTYDGISLEPEAHYHPNQDETFKVIQGQVNIRIDDSLIVLRQGETLNIPRNKVHSMWNELSQTTILNWKVMPALNTEYLLETMAGLPTDTKTNEKGMPGLLQLSVIAGYYSDVVRLAKPSYVVQRILFGLLKPVAYLAGYRPTYKRYLD